MLINLAKGAVRPLAGDDGGVAPARYQLFIPLYGEAVKCSYLEDGKLISN